MKLLEAFEMRPFTLKNRVVMAPMTRSRASPDGVLPDIAAIYYAQRASAGLIVTEATNIAPDAVGYPHTPGIWSVEQVAAWSKVTRAVHDSGGLIFIQLWHTGRISHPFTTGGKTPVAPSAIRPEGVIFTVNGLREFVTPRAMTTADIRKTIANYVNAARNAMHAGFDGVELHAAHGYLPHQFLSSGSNCRGDEYGGAIENRARFVLELMRALTFALGRGLVAIKLSPSDTHNGISESSPNELYRFLISELNQLKLAYVHLAEPSETASLPPWYPREVARHFRQYFDGPLIANGGFDDGSGCEIIESGFADLVSFGRSFLANPDLPERFRRGATLNTPFPETFYGGNGAGYIDYPFLDAT